MPSQFINQMDIFKPYPNTVVFNSADDILLGTRTASARALSLASYPSDFPSHFLLLFTFSLDDFKKRKIQSFFSLTSMILFFGYIPDVIMEKLSSQVPLYSLRCLLLIFNDLL